MNWSYIILQLSIWIILVPLVAGLLFFRHLDEPSRIVFYVVVLAAVPQLLTASLDQTKGLNIVYNIYTPIEFIFLYFLLGNNYSKKAFAYTSTALLIAFFALAAALTVKEGLYDKFLNELVCAANTVYLIWIFLYILQGVLTDQRLMNPRLPMFWFVAGLLIYTPCTIFAFALTDYIAQSTHRIISNLWSIHGVFNTVMYCLFAVGFFQSYRLSKAQLSTV